MVNYALFPIIGILFYVLYVNGCVIQSSKRAVTFVGFMRGDNRCSAKFSVCDGYMKRVIKFKDDRTYHFKLESELTTGTFSVEFQDSKKNTLFILNENDTKASIDINRHRRYFLVFKFQSATGDFELKWE